MDSMDFSNCHTATLCMHNGIMMIERNLLENSLILEQYSEEKILWTHN